MAGVLIENLTLPEGARRAVVSPDALHDWTLRGWVACGPAAEGADGLFTEQEWAEEVARRESEVKAALAGTVTNPRTTAKKG